MRTVVRKYIHGNVWTTLHISSNYGKTHIFLRYIDDLFFIWTGTEQQLESFLEEINEVHPTIKFDSKFSKDEINFLDLTIYKDSNGKLATKVYTKPTDRQSYLYRTSTHPEHLKKSIPYGQALCLKKICSQEGEFNNACKQLTEKMKIRGYKEKEIQEQILRASQQNRNALLQYKERIPLQKIQCVVTYNPRLPHIKEAIDKHWDILKIDPKLKTAFSEMLFMAFKRNRRLRDIIGQKTIVNNKVKRNEDIITQRGWCSPWNSHGRMVQSMEQSREEPLLQTNAQH